MIRRWMLGLSALTMAACSDSDPTSSGGHGRQTPDNSLMRVISGSVIYRERIALPPGVEVRVVLEDQSRMDAPAIEITDYTHAADGPPPYDFRLVVDPSKFDDRVTYGLRARIEHESQLMFTSTEHIDPFAVEPGQPIEIMVRRVGGSPDR